MVRTKDKLDYTVPFTLVVVNKICLLYTSDAADE